MEVTVYDEDTFTDDTVGSTKIDLAKYISSQTEEKCINKYMQNISASLTRANQQENSTCRSGTSEKVLVAGEAATIKKVIGILPRRTEASRTPKTAGEMARKSKVDGNPSNL